MVVDEVRERAEHKPRPKPKQQQRNHPRLERSQTHRRPKVRAGEAPRQRLLHQPVVAAAVVEEAFKDRPSRLEVIS